MLLLAFLTSFINNSNKSVLVKYLRVNNLDIFISSLVCGTLWMDGPPRIFLYCLYDGPALTV